MFGIMKVMSKMLLFQNQRSPNPDSMASSRSFLRTVVVGRYKNKCHMALPLTIFFLI